MLHRTPFITAYLLTAALLLGLVFGSFCNAWGWRIVHNESIAKGRSHCAVCGHTLRVPDLIPLFSWFCLKGKCRYCGAPISKRYPLAELICGLYFVSILFVWDVSWETLRFWILGALLLVLSLVDWDIYELPDGLVAAVALTALLRIPAEGVAAVPDACLGALAIAVPLLLFVLLADRVMGRETMGGGDIKLLAALGFHFGAAQMLLLLILACFIGIGFALVQQVRGQEMPFGPSIALAAWLTALIGTPVITWYLGLFF